MNGYPPFGPGLHPPPPAPAPAAFGEGGGASACPEDLAGLVAEVTALVTRGLKQDAERACRAVLIRQPGAVEILVILGELLMDLGRFDQAEPTLARAVVICPHDARAWLARGVNLARAGRTADAIRCFERTLALSPVSAETLFALGQAHRDLCRSTEALDWLRRAVTLDPEHAAAHWALSLELLRSGRLSEGWREYGWRWRTAQLERQRRTFFQPRWTGAPLSGRTLLLHAEQNLGDTLDFIRYLPLVLTAGAARVVLEVQAALVPLLKPALESERITVVPPAADYPGSNGLPRFDVHTPLLDLPRLFGTTFETIPPPAGCIKAPPQRVAAWRERLDAMAGGKRGLKVGVAWAGSPHHANDRNRSLALERLHPLAGVTGAKLYSLQVGARASEVREWQGTPLTPLDRDLTNFVETAAAVTALDLVISVDTSLAHLTGTLGRPLWLLLPFSPDWRWFSGRDDSPWYPSARLYRQPRPGDWETVAVRLARDLSTLARGNGDFKPGK